CCPERATIWSGRLSHNHGVADNDTGVSESDDSTDFIKQKALGYIDAYETDDAQPWFMQISPHAPHDETTDPWFTWPERYNDVEVPARAPNPAFDLEGVGNPNGDDAIKTAKADKVSAIGRKTPGDGYAELMDTYHHGQLKTLLPADDMIDQVMRRLEANGELDNTLVIFTSDNGFSVGERVVDSKGWPYREHVSVPFWVRWPGVVPAGATDLRPVGGEDILPTLLDAAQYTPPTFGHPLDGRSFLPHQPAREFKYLEFGPGPGASDVTIDNYQGHRAIPTWAAIRTPEFHYIEYYEGTGEGDTVADHTTLRSDGQEYYDLTRDPWQLDNLLSEEVAGVAKPDPARIAELSRRLGELRRCAGTTGANPCP
ncbi:MAG: sulfatase-like hydrolase/transferase, partial [Acidimicrobiia bacterium]